MKPSAIIISRHLHSLSRRCNPPLMVRNIFTNRDAGNDTDKIRSNSSFETSDDFERRIFSGLGGDNPSTDSFYQKLDRLEKARAGSKMNDGNDFGFGNGMADGFNPLSDGMDGKLKKAATSNVYNDEIHEDDYAFRPDVSFKQGMTYTPKDLDLTKTGVQKYVERESEFDGITTDAVLKKADFRNVRFLAKFLTEAGIIIKRKQTGISAKAQRKVAREIKTARAFGLMPFTTMGRKPFCFGKTMEDLDEDYEMDYYDTRPGRVDPIKE